MRWQQLLYNKSVINYGLFGNGPKLAFCFHGYGETADAFGFLEKFAGNKYTFIAIDMPHHGNTKWNESTDCSIGEILKVIQKILYDNNLLPVIQSPFTILGFSLGGRIAMTLFQSMPEKVEKLVLLAPDGMKVNFWYWFATQTYLGNRLFAFTMKHPNWFFTMLRILNKLKLVNASIFKFVRFYIKDQSARFLLYNRWTTFRSIKPNIAVIKDTIIKNKTPVFLIYGKHDRIILSSVGEKFRKGIEEYCTLSVINSGHQVLHEKHAGDILSALLQ